MPDNNKGVSPKKGAPSNTAKNKSGSHTVKKNNYSERVQRTVSERDTVRELNRRMTEKKTSEKKAVKGTLRNDEDRKMISVMSGFVGSIPGEEGDLEGRTFEFFRNCLEKGTIIPQMTFSLVIPGRGLSMRAGNGDIEVYMPVEEVIDRNMVTTDRLYVSNDHLNRSYSVVVIGVDEAEKKIVVSYLKAREKIRPIVESRIQKALKSGERPVVRARVTKLVELGTEQTSDSSMYGAVKKVYLDIEGLGIRGVMRPEGVGDFYVADMRFYLRLNEIVNVEITKLEHFDIENGRKTRYECSMKSLRKSPWDNASFAKGMHVRVKCISPAKGRGLTRMSSGLICGGVGTDDVERGGVPCKLYAPYEIRLELGARYEGVIKQYIREKHLLEVNVTKSLVEGGVFPR